MNNLVDMHIHSIYSDGVRLPAELVRLAAEQGLTAIAIADHDAVEGIDEAMQEGERLGVEVVPAVELSAEHDRYRDMHILGYFINHRDQAFRNKLAEFREVRDNRGRAMVDKINRRLVAIRCKPISYEEVLAIAGEAVGRPHIGRVLIGRGYARDMEDAFRRYLIPYNVPKKYIPASEAIAEIRRVGGVAVLAHPTTVTEDHKELRRVIGELASLGLDGLEVFNNMCYKADMLFFERLVADLGLIMTGGSDFHGFEDDVRIGIGRGGLAVPRRLVEETRMRATSRVTATEVIHG